MFAIIMIQMNPANKKHRVGKKAPIKPTGTNPENKWGAAVSTRISHFQVYTSRVPEEETYPFDIHKPFAYTVAGWQSLLIGFYVQQLLFLLVKLVEVDYINPSDVGWIIHILIDRKTIYIC